MNFSQFLRGSSVNENRGSWPQPLVLARTPSSVVFWFLDFRKRVIWLDLTFDTILGKRKHYESRRHFFSSPHMLGQSITNWGHNTLSVPKNELRAGHELRKTLSFMMVRSKSYIPTGIFSKARLHIFDRNSIPIVISGDGTSLKILLIPLNSKKVQRDAIYRKMQSSKLSQSKRNLKLTSIAKSTNSNLLLPTSPLPL